MNINCNQSQYKEAFADWLATEAYVHYRQNDLNAAGGSSGKQPQIDLAARLRDAPFLFEAHALFCWDVGSRGWRADDNHLDHQSSTQRMNSIFLSQPAIRAALGCPGSYDDDHVIKRTDEPIHQQLNRHCDLRMGEDLK